jgi:hypothetical protein
MGTKASWGNNPERSQNEFLRHIAVCGDAESILQMPEVSMGRVSGAMLFRSWKDDRLVTDTPDKDQVVWNGYSSVGPEYAYQSGKGKRKRCESVPSGVYTLVVPDSIEQGEDPTRRVWLVNSAADVPVLNAIELRLSTSTDQVGVYIEGVFASDVELHTVENILKGVSRAHINQQQIKLKHTKEKHRKRVRKVVGVLSASLIAGAVVEGARSIDWDCAGQDYCSSEAFDAEHFRLLGGAVLAEGQQITPIYSNQAATDIGLSRENVPLIGEEYNYSNFTPDNTEGGVSPSDPANLSSPRQMIVGKNNPPGNNAKCAIAYIATQPDQLVRVATDDSDDAGRLTVERHDHTITVCLKNGSLLADDQLRVVLQDVLSQ